MPSQYLARLLTQYSEHQARADEIHDRAAAEGRDALTADETRDADAALAAMDALVPQIERLEPMEARNRRMADLAGRVAGDVDQDRQDRSSDQRPGQAGGRLTGEVRGDGADQQDRGRQGGQQGGQFTAHDRDPGHYRSVVDGGTGSFFHDLVHAREGDDAARQRLTEHQRALSTGVAGAGIVPPKWLQDLYQPLNRQGRMLSAAVQRIDLGDDPRPMTLPKQTIGTDGVVAEQATENTHPSETDSFATDTDTVTPKPTSGIQVVSRQMIDMSTPAADALIYSDLMSVYDTKIEAKVATAVVAAAGTAVTTFATEAAFSLIDPVPVALNAVIDAEFAVWGARFLPADLAVMRIGRWGKFRKLRDLDGRALIPPELARQTMVNVEGVGTVAARGQIEDLAVIPTSGLGTTAYPETIIVMRAADTILFEGAMQRFRFEEVAGPESVKLGIWAYSAVIVRNATSSVRKIVITAAGP